MITEDEYKQWLKYAKPGDWVTYHIGQHLFGINAMKKGAANMIFVAAEEGELFIAQRRIKGTDPAEFEYRAMKLDTKLQKELKSWSR